MARASVMLPNQCSFRHSSRILSLRLSLTAFLVMGLLTYSAIAENATHPERAAVVLAEAAVNYFQNSLIKKLLSAIKKIVFTYKNPILVNDLSLDQINMDDFPYGSLIENINVANLNIDVFSNGSSNFLSEEISTDSEGAYLGIKYQCVEFVRRFIYHRHKVNLANRWRNKNALDWFSNRDKMNLISIDLEMSRPGDIITFSGGLYGHIGVVKNIQGDGIKFCSQNLFNDIRDAEYFLSFKSLYQENDKNDLELKEYAFQSILRLKD
jgi:hypothetical protein